jgi:hypothetical protein
MDLMPAFEYFFGPAHSVTVRYRDPEAPSHYPDTRWAKFKRGHGRCCYRNTCLRRAEVCAAIQPVDANGKPATSHEGPALPAHQVKLCDRHRDRLLLDAARMLQVTTVVSDLGVTTVRRDV